MELAGVAVAREHDPRAVGRPARAVALIPARAVGESRDSTPVRVHGKDFGAAGAEARERDPLAVRSPDRIDVSARIVGVPGDVGPVRVHHVDLEVTVAGAVERDLTAEACRGGQAEPRSIHPGGERSFGVVASCEKSPEGEEWDQACYCSPWRRRRMKSVDHILLLKKAHRLTLVGEAIASLSAGNASRTPATTATARNVTLPICASSPVNV